MVVVTARLLVLACLSSAWLISQPLQADARRIDEADGTSNQCNLDFTNNPSAPTLSMMDAGSRLSFSSLYTEMEDLPLEVCGQIPQWVDGSLIRNGVGLLEFAGKKFKNPLDAFSMLHAWRIKDGSITYNNRFIATARRDRMLRTGTISGMRTFGGTDPCDSVMGHMKSWFTFGDEVIVSVGKVGDKTVAMGELPNMYSFDPNTLTTESFVEVWKSNIMEPEGAPEHLSHNTGFESAAEEQLGASPLSMPAGMGMAHPHYTPNGTFISRLERVNPVGRDSTVVYAIPPGTAPEDKVILGEWPVTTPGPHYVHSFSITDRYVILPEYPVIIDKPAMIASSTILSGFKWLKEHGTNMTVLDLHTGEMTRYNCPEVFFAFHTINAFEDEQTGELHMDVLGASDYSTLFALFVDVHNPRTTSGGFPAGTLRRITIPLRDPSKGITIEHDNKNVFMELPRINYAFNGKPYRYFYACGSTIPNSFPMDLIVKKDLATGKLTRFQIPGAFLGEPIFAAAPNASAEDDGVVLTHGLDTETGLGFMIVVDAKTMTLVARSDLPQHLPFLLHGGFFE